MIACAAAEDDGLVGSPRHPYTDTDSSRPWVIAHRGGMARWPENTLFAFEHAVAAGADVVEMDVHASRDEELMVIHDPDVDRVTDGRGAVAELSRAELQQLDAAYHFSDASGAYTLRGRGVHIPTFGEVLSAIREARVSVEIKPADPSLASKLCALIRSHGAGQRVMVGSFAGEVVTAFREVCPEVATSLTVGEASEFYLRSRLGFASAVAAPSEVIIVPRSVFGLDAAAPSLLRSARRSGLRALVFTVNAESQILRLLRDGVGGIVTDDPLKTRRIIDSFLSGAPQIGPPVE